MYVYPDGTPLPFQFADTPVVIPYPTELDNEVSASEEEEESEEDRSEEETGVSLPYRPAGPPVVAPPLQVRGAITGKRMRSPPRRRGRQTSSSCILGPYINLLPSLSTPLVWRFFFSDSF